MKLGKIYIGYMNYDVISFKIRHSLFDKRKIEASRKNHSIQIKIGRCDVHVMYMYRKKTITSPEYY